MTKEEVGKLLNYLRRKKNIDLEKLCLGVCSGTCIKRLERGERFPDFFVMERILQRLGKSVNKMELLPDEQAYKIYYLREVIENNLEKENYVKVINEIAYYESMEIANHPLHQQYIYKIKAILEDKYYLRIENSIEYLEKAMILTIPKFNIGKINEFFLGEEEMTLVLMWIEKESVLKKIDILENREKILNYIRKYFTDEEVLANIYGKASWIFMNEFIKRGRKVEAASIGIHMIDILVSNGLLLNLPQFLELLLFCYKDVNKKKYQEWKKQIDALKWVYKTYGKKYETKKINMWKNYHQNEIYLMSEVIGEERKLLKKTQKQVANELDIDQKTISRIETGKYSPRKKTFEKLKEYMSIDRDICSTRLVVEEFELLELERNISREISFERYEKAEQLYKELKERLSMEYNENKQYVMYRDIIFDRIKGKITEEETIKRCWEAFKVTRKNCEIENLSKVVLSKYETMIVNYISKMYRKLGDKEKAVYILEQALVGFENSKVDKKYHFASVSIIYECLSCRYEENNQFDKAIEICNKGILFELRCERGDTIGDYVMQKTYTEERRTGLKKACQYYYQQAYQLQKLMKKEIKSILDLLIQELKSEKHAC